MEEPIKLSSENIQKVFTEARKKLKANNKLNKKPVMIMSRLSMIIMYSGLNNTGTKLSTIKRRMRKWWTDYQIIYTPKRKKKIEHNPNWDCRTIEPTFISNT